jgi:hypothetical protein
VGHFPDKEALVCLDIILLKSRFEGQKIYFCEIGFYLLLVYF